MFFDFNCVEGRESEESFTFSMMCNYFLLRYKQKQILIHLISFRELIKFNILGICCSVGCYVHYDAAPNINCYNIIID